MRKYEHKLGISTLNPIVWKWDRKINIEKTYFNDIV